jgi:hypothetical protein
MFMYVVSYFLTFATIRALMDKLEIDDRGVEEERIEFAINNWLAEQSDLMQYARRCYWPSRHWQTEQGRWHSYHGAVFLNWQACPTLLSRKMIETS